LSARRNRCKRDARENEGAAFGRTNEDTAEMVGVRVIAGGALVLPYKAIAALRVRADETLARAEQITPDPRQAISTEEALEHTERAIQGARHTVA
jgi:hypothetical protein